MNSRGSEGYRPPKAKEGVPGLGEIYEIRHDPDRIMGEILPGPEGVSRFGMQMIEEEVKTPEGTRIICKWVNPATGKPFVNGPIFEKLPNGSLVCRN